MYTLEDGYSVGELNIRVVTQLDLQDFLAMANSGTISDLSDGYIDLLYEYDAMVTVQPVIFWKRVSLEKALTTRCRQCCMSGRNLVWEASQGELREIIQVDVNPGGRPEVRSAGVPVYIRATSGIGTLLEGGKKTRSWPVRPDDNMSQFTHTHTRTTQAGLFRRSA